MRKLSKKQKTFIDKWLKNALDNGEQVYSIDDMPIEMQEELRIMNDHETLWSNIDRYISDKIFDMTCR